MFNFIRLLGVFVPWWYFKFLGHADDGRASLLVEERFDLPHAGGAGGEVEGAFVTEFGGGFQKGSEGDAGQTRCCGYFEWCDQLKWNRLRRRGRVRGFAQLRRSTAFPSRPRFSIER